MVKSEKTLPLSPLRPNKKSLPKKEKKEKKSKLKVVEIKSEMKENREKVEEKQEKVEEKQENVEEKQPEKEKPPPKPVVTLQKQQIEEGLKAFKSLLAAKKKDDQKELFGDGPARIFLQVAGIKLPADADTCIVKVRLPHTALASDADTLLVVKDLEKGIKADHEPTLQHYTSLLEDKQVTAIAEVMPLRQLRVEYKEFEAKRQLCNRFERVLVDDRVIRLVPQFLGKPFYKKRKLPVAVDLTKTDLKKEISRCIATEQMPLKNHGSCASLAVGVTSLGNNELLENIEVAVKALESGYPGGWKNVRSVHLFCSNTSLPIYLTDRTGAEVGKVETKNAARRRDRIVVDELSTIPGATVTVNRAGAVKLKRDPDETWRDDVYWEQAPKRMKKNPEPAEDTEETIETPTEKNDQEPKKKKQKKKKGKKTEDSDSDDDDMENMEMEYMRKVAEQEEEIERKEKENMEKLGTGAEDDTTARDAAADSDDEEQDTLEEEDTLEDEEESEADDDIEVENLLSDQEEDEDEPDQQLIMDRNAESDEAPEEPVVEEEKKKLKKKKKKDQKKVGTTEAKKKSGKKNTDQSPESKKAKKQKKPKKEEKKVKSDSKKSKKKK